MKTIRKRDWILPPPTLTPVQQIVVVVAREFGFKPSDLFGQRRYPEIVEARQVAYLIAREMTGWSSAKIARAFGSRHHTTILDGVKAAQDRMTPRMRNKIERMKAELSMTIGDDE